MGERGLCSSRIKTQRASNKGVVMGLIMPQCPPAWSVQHPLARMMLPHPTPPPSMTTWFRLRAGRATGECLSVSQGQGVSCSARFNNITWPLRPCSAHWLGETEDLYFCPKHYTYCTYFISTSRFHEKEESITCFSEVDWRVVFSRQTWYYLMFMLLFLSLYPFVSRPGQRK